MRHDRRLGIEQNEGILLDSKKLRILQIISSTATSGAERHVLDLCRELSARGHYVEVVTPQGGWLPSALRGFQIPAVARQMRKFGTIQTLNFVTGRLLLGRFDLIHTHLGRASYIGLAAGTLAGKPVVGSVHIGNSDEVYTRIAHGRNRLIAVSNFIAGSLRGRGIPSSFVSTIYNGTSFANTPSTPMPQSGQQAAIGVVGRICPEKGHPEVISALREVNMKYPGIQAYFVGRIVPSFANELERLIFESGLKSQIVLCGECTDVAAILDKLSFTILASHKESFGIAAIESLARGRPVVASNVGGLPEVISHGETGLLVEPRTPDIVNACLHLLSNPAECKRLGDSGRKRVESAFTVERMAEKVETLYYQML